MTKKPTTTIFTIPNILSSLRLAAVPFLLYLAWIGRPHLFLLLLALSLFSDLIDGSIARILNQTSELGAKLDSWGDLATYLAMPFCAWWLWPDILKREAFFVLFILGAYSIPLIAGFIKFRQLPNYHTWAAKAAMIILSTTAIALVLTDIAWPFRCAALAQGLVALEEVIITLRLSKLRSNVRSLRHLRRVLHQEHTRQS